MRCATLFSLIAATLASALFAAPAQAQRDRVFVASYGNDANPCTFGSPCKTFQAAYMAVATGGEVTAIDSAGFGPLSISKSVTITSPDGVEAGVVKGTAPALITIAAGTSDVVVLHGLTLDGDNSASEGIDLTSGGSLTIENCVIRNMTGEGLIYSGTGTPQKLAVSDSYFINDAAGIYIYTNTAGAITASIDRTGLYGNSGQGLELANVGNPGDGNINVAVTDSVATNNGVAFYVGSSDTGVANLSVTHSLVQGNGTGFLTNGTSATIWLAQSTATGNGADWNASPTDSIKTYGDNDLAAANGTNTGSLGSATKQ
jgi:hypothetical protein